MYVLRKRICSTNGSICTLRVADATAEYVPVIQAARPGNTVSCHIVSQQSHSADPKLFTVASAMKAHVQPLALHANTPFQAVASGLTWGRERKCGHKKTLRPEGPPRHWLHHYTSEPHRFPFPGWLWHLADVGRLPGGQRARTLAPLTMPIQLSASQCPP